jgi:hypothetical protein
MPRSSESVAALASALAKAQAELVNPEKSLTATIKGARAGEADRTFSYAPLSSGLEIIRKTLSQHQIAAIQTTATDEAARVVWLTTTLAHASGEWIASDWPVCTIADMASPKRMGSALTYARRYALFTLVGIAGEDDLDAPDLCHAEPNSPGPASGNGKVGDVQLGNSPLPRGHFRAAAKPTVPVLPPDQSAALRDRLLREIPGLSDVDKAASWAREVLVAKNSLAAADSRSVESEFEQRLAKLGDPAAVDEQAPSAAEQIKPAAGAAGATTDVAGAADPAVIDKSVLTIAEPRRYRNKEHLRFVATKACVICGRRPTDPHHLRFTQPRALGRKVSDEFAVPLCRGHHRAVHRSGDERAWWKATGIEPLKVARKLWRQSRLNGAQDGHEVGLTAPPNLRNGAELPGD